MSRTRNRGAFDIETTTEALLAEAKNRGMFIGLKNVQVGQQVGPHVRVGGLILCSGGGATRLHFGWPNREKATCGACAAMVAIAAANRIEFTQSGADFRNRINQVIKKASET